MAYVDLVAKVEDLGAARKMRDYIQAMRSTYEERKEAAAAEERAAEEAAVTAEQTEDWGAQAGFAAPSQADEEAEAAELMAAAKAKRLARAAERKAAFAEALTAKRALADSESGAVDEEGGPKRQRVDDNIAINDDDDDDEAPPLGEAFDQETESAPEPIAQLAYDDAEARWAERAAEAGIDEEEEEEDVPDFL